MNASSSSSEGSGSQSLDTVGNMVEENMVENMVEENMVENMVEENTAQRFLEKTSHKEMSTQRFLKKDERPQPDDEQQQQCCLQGSLCR